MKEVTAWKTLRKVCTSGIFRSICSQCGTGAFLPFASEGGGLSPARSSSFGLPAAPQPCLQACSPGSCQPVFCHLHPKPRSHSHGHYRGPNSTQSVTLIERVFCPTRASSTRVLPMVWASPLAFKLFLLPTAPEGCSGTEVTSDLQPVLPSLVQTAGF